MPIRRFRSVEEMNEPRWRTPGDPALYRAIRAVWDVGDRAQRRRFPPGVWKHRTIESLNALTEQWAAENFRAFQARRPRHTE